MKSSDKGKKTMTKKSLSRYNNKHCDNKMTFDECKIAILRNAIDESENLKGKRLVNSEDVKQILQIVEDFIIRKKLVCYGGTAINNILPKYDQFYDKNIEIPDYDFFSPNALSDAKELADIYYNKGYTEVEAKSGVHYGTFKVFVNYIPIADITLLPKEVYNSISKESIKNAGIRYAPPNYLRMAMYLELSRPSGDVSRWEKVFKRLSLLNKHYPLELGNKCDTIDFTKKIDLKSSKEERMHVAIRDALIDNGVVFFGGYSTHLYAQHMSKEKSNRMKSIPDFDVIAEEPDKTALIVKERLHQEDDFGDITIIKHSSIGDIIPAHVEVKIGKDSLAFIYKPIACHSYNKINANKKEVYVATIDTILSFYLAFIYADMPHYDKNRLLCIASYLFEVEKRNSLRQSGILKRFSLSCYGEQETLVDMRAKKTNKYKELRSKPDSAEYEMWFLRYVPDSDKKTTKKPIRQTRKKKDSKVKSTDSQNTGIIAKLFNL